jgi:hypothetical protein
MHTCIQQEESQIAFSRQICFVTQRASYAPKNTNVYFSCALSMDNGNIYIYGCALLTIPDVDVPTIC